MWKKCMSEKKIRKGNVKRNWACLLIKPTLSACQSSTYILERGDIKLYWAGQRYSQPQIQCQSLTCSIQSKGNFKLIWMTHKSLFFTYVGKQWDGKFNSLVKHIFTMYSYKYIQFQTSSCWHVAIVNFLYVQPKIGRKKKNPKQNKNGWYVSLE